MNTTAKTKKEYSKNRFQNNIPRLLGKDQQVSNNDIVSGFNNNDLIVGGSGCGKTGGYVIPNIRQGYGNMIVTDTKSQLNRILYHDLKSQGYDVSVLDFVNPEKSVAYNPLDYIRMSRDPNGMERYSEKDIVSLARLLIPGYCNKDPFWEDSARTVISFLIAFTLEALRKQEHTMHSVIELFKVLQNNKKQLEQWLMKNPDSFAARKYEMFKAVTTVDKTWQCIVQFVSEALEPFDFAEMNQIFGKDNPNKFRFSDLWTKKKILFVNISDTDRYADRLANLFYSQAMQQLCSAADKRPDGRLPRPVRFILDDFASNVYIENFDKILSVIRSRNISASVILQSLTQLESLYSKAQANTIITNCDHLLYLGGQDIDTAHYIGYRCNKTEEAVMLMPKGKAYLIERGKIGQIIDRIPPYADLKDNPDLKFSSDKTEQEFDSQDIPF